MTRRNTAPAIPKDGTFSAEAFWKKIARIPARTSARLIHDALLLYCILTDRSTPAWVRALILVALVYLINPFDAVPDALPGVGLADDAAAIGVLLAKLASYVTPAIEARATALLPKAWRRNTEGKPASQNPEIPTKKSTTKRRATSNGKKEKPAG